MTTALKPDTDVTAYLARAEAIYLEQHRMWKSLTDSGVLATELVTLNANGQWSRHWAVPFRTVHIDNLGVGAMTVTDNGPSGFAPGASPGVQRIPAGGSATLALNGHALTIYGTAGDQANVQIFERPYPPSFSGTGGGGSAGSSSGAALTTAVITNALAPAFLAANPARKGALITNEGPSSVYLAFALVATTVAYTVQIGAGEYYEVPGPSVYAGPLAAISTGTATLRVTELT